MSQQTPQKRVLFPRALALALAGGFVVFAVISVFFSVRPQSVEAATNSTLNFQARLENNAGNIVADGYYNVEFKLYGVSSGGSALWTETHYDSNGVTAGNDNRIQVRNGYVTANLGSLTSFPGTINWDQDLWVTMNVGGTTQTATPTWDGEMNPRLKLTGVPYAFKAGQLATFNQATGFTSSLAILQPTGGNQTFQIQDQTMAGTYNICIQNSSACGFALSNGSASYIQNQNAAQQAGANFWLSGTGRADTALQAPLIDTATAVALDIGTTNATMINLNENVNVASGKLFTANGNALFQSNVASTTAFQIATTSGTPLFNVDTTTLNLITNSSFEANITNWAAKGAGSTLSQTSAQAYHGFDSIQAVVTAASSGVQTSTFTSAITTATQYEATFMARCSASFTTFTYGRQDVSGTDINATTTATCNTNWQRYTFHYTTGGTVTSPNIYMTLGSTTSGTLFVDAVQVLQTTTNGAQAYTAGNIKIGGVITDAVVLRNSVNSTNAFEVQNAAGTGNNLVVDTVNNRVNINTTGFGAGLNVNGTTIFQTASTTALQVRNTSSIPIFTVDTSTNSSNNKVTNYGFEVNTTGWANITGGTISRQTTTTNAYHGVASGQVVTTATANAGVRTTSFIATQAAGTYTFSFYAKVNSGTFTTLNAGYNQGSGDVACTLTSNTVLTTGFQRYSCTFTSTANLASLWITQTDATVRTFYIDAVQLVPGTSATAYSTNGAIQLRGAVNSPVTFQSTSNSTTAFQIQDSAGTSNLFVADTLNNQINIGGALNVSGTTTVTTLDATTGIQTGGTTRIDASGNLSNIGTITASGNITTSGLFIEKSVTFTPTTVGWYRIVNGGASHGGTVRIKASYDNTQTDVELQYNIGGYSTNGSIQQTRYSSYNAGAVSQARISSDGSAAAYLDIYVSTATIPGPITVYGFGPSMPTFVSSPVVGATAGSTNVHTLTLGHGFRSTSGSNFAETTGGVGIGTNAPGAYKLNVQGGNVNFSGGLYIAGTEVITSARALQNVDIDAADLTSGTLASARISGSYTGITGVGTLTTGTWTASVISDTYISDTLTVDSSSSVAWTALTNYPTACSAGQAVTTIGDTLTCSVFATVDTDTTYTAGNDLDLSGTTFNIESQLDFVTTISRASSNLTLQTTTSGNIILNSAGTIELQDNTNVTGNLKVVGGFTSAGYPITNPAGTFINQWTRLGRCNVVAQYRKCEARIQIISTNSGSAGAFAVADIDWRVKQQAPLASAPIVEVFMSNSNYISKSDIVAVTVQNDVNATVVDLFIRPTAGSMQYEFNPQLASSTNNNELTWYTDDGYSISLPVGTQAVAIYKNAYFVDGSFEGNLSVGGQQVITSGQVLQNVTANASILTAGTISSSLLTGSYTGITGVGTLTAGTWTADVIANAYVADDLTVSSSGSVHWSALNNFPTACSAGQAVTAVGSTLTCSTFATTDTNTTYTAGNDLDLSGTTFNIESQLDSVSIISRASSALTLQTTTSGNIILNSAGTIELQDDTNVTGTISSTGNATFQGRLLTLSNFEPEYRWKFGGATDLNWKKIADISVAGGTYDAASFQVDVLDANTNFGNTSNAIPMRFYVSAVRSNGVVNDADTGTVSGPSTDYVRLVKTALGVYELQVRQTTNFKHIEVTARAISWDGATITYVVSPADGSTVGTVYTSSVTGYTQELPNADVNGNLAVGGTITGATLQNAGTLNISATGANQVNFNTNGSLRWSVLSGGELQSNGASTIRTSTGALTLQSTTSGNIILNSAGTIELQDNTNVTGTLVTSSTVQGTQLISTVATGTAPLTVTSTTKVTNLNVDQLDGLDSTAFAAATGSSSYIQNQNASAQSSSNLWISGTSKVDTAVLTPRLDTNTAGTLAIGNTTQTGITIGRTSGSTNYVTTVSGTAVFKNNADSATAFQIQNAASISFFTADSTNQRITTKDLVVGSPTYVGITTRLFSESFESGMLGSWLGMGNSGAGSATDINSSVVRGGKYSLRVNSVSGYGYVSNPIAPNSTVYARTYFNATTVGNPTPLISFRNDDTGAGSGNELYVYLGTSGNLCYSSNLGGAASACSATAPSASAWHKLEARLTTSATVGVLQVYLDGALVTSNANAINLSGQNFGATTIGSFSLGKNVSGTSTVYFDDIAIDTVPTGDSSSVYVSDTLDVSGSSSVGVLTVTGSSGLGVSIDTAGIVNAGGGFSAGGETGLSSSCSNGQGLKDTQVSGGIIIGGSCGNAASTLQDAYDNTEQSSGGSISTPALVQQVSNSLVNSTTVAASISATGAGNLLVALVTTGGDSTRATVSGVTGGGTWYQAAVGLGGNAGTHTELWYCYNCASATTVTATVSHNRGARTIQLSEYSGIYSASDPLEAAAGGSGSSPTSSTQVSPLITTTSANNLIYAGMSFYNASVTSVSTPSGFTALTSVEMTNKKAYADYIASAPAGSYSATWNQTGGQSNAGVITAAFRPAASGGSNVASILLADAKDYVLTAPDTATDPNIIVNMQCRTGCSTSQGRWAVQSNGTDALSVLYDTSTSITNIRIQTGVDLKLAADTVGNARGAITHDFTCASGVSANDIVVISASGTVGFAAAAGDKSVVGVVVAKPSSTICTTAISGVVQVWGSSNTVTIGDPVQAGGTDGSARTLASPGVASSIGKALSDKDGNNLFWVLIGPST